MALTILGALCIVAAADLSNRISSAAEPEYAAYHESLTKIYANHRPELVPKVAQILERNAGCWPSMMRGMQKKYKMTAGDGDDAMGGGINTEKNSLFYEWHKFQLISICECTCSC